MASGYKAAAKVNVWPLLITESHWGYQWGFAWTLDSIPKLQQVGVSYLQLGRMNIFEHYIMRMCSIIIMPTAIVKPLCTLHTVQCVL